MPARTRLLSLLPKTEFETSGWGRFLQWALSTGRYIVIVTEMVVIVAFLSRFKLDRDVADLTERIEGKKNVLAAGAENEQKFRSVQSRLVTIDNIVTAQMPVGAVMNELNSDTPKEVRVTSMNMTTGGMTLSAVVTSEKALAEFLSRLKENQRWKNLEVTDVTLDKAAGIKLALRLTW